MLEMNPEIRARWCEALRSGTYQQGRCYLRQGDKYCCLGVLEELRLKEVGSDWIIDWKSEAIYVPQDDPEHQCVLSDSTVEWAGLESHSPYVNDRALHAYNDLENKTFAEIADIIDGGQDVKTPAS